MTTHALPLKTPPLVAIRPLRASDSERIRLWMRSPDLVRFTVLVPSPISAIFMRPLSYVPW